jgi:predicted nucleic acid-binding protein
MRIIVDTSVWIEYFKGNEKYFDFIQELLEKNEIITIELIFAELLQGARNKKETEMLKSYYGLIPKAEIENLCILAGEFSRQEKFISKGIGLIDACIITATIFSDSRLWTLDKKIQNYLNSRYLFQNRKT